MAVVVCPSTPSGTVDAPPSKSMAQRAIAAACVAQGPSKIRVGRPSADIQAACRAASGLGAAVAWSGDTVQITPGPLPETPVLACGESGLSLRMFAAVAALYDRPIELRAEGTLRTRPVSMIPGPLQALGARCDTHQGFPPVTVHGPMTGTQVTVDAGESSQFLTGLLIASAARSESCDITAVRVTSRPYVYMTCALLHTIGAHVEWDTDLRHFSVGGRPVAGFEYAVPGDWSGAAFLLVAGATRGSVTVRGLDPRSPQADRRILDVLRAAGAAMDVSDDRIAVRSGPLRPFTFDATDCPDLFPPLAALAAACEGTSAITGVHRLAIKESNRERAIIEEFAKVGIAIHTEGDTMLVRGGVPVGGRIDPRGDHRMAMALAVTALRATEPVTIDDPQCTTKSYPHFFDDLRALGVTIHE